MGLCFDCCLQTDFLSDIFISNDLLSSQMPDLIRATTPHPAPGPATVLHKSQQTFHVVKKSPQHT